MPARRAVPFAIVMALVIVVLLALVVATPPSPTDPIRAPSFETTPSAPSGSPSVSSTVTNVGITSTTALEGLWSSQAVFRIPFSTVTQAEPLRPGEEAYGYVLLSGVEVSWGSSYPLEFDGSYASGGSFAITGSYPITCVNET